MIGDKEIKCAVALRRTGLITLVLIAAALTFHAVQRPLAARAAFEQARQSSEEISASQQIQPEELAKEIEGKDKPIVVCVAPRFLYNGAHVPGALFHGPASKAEGLDDLRKWAQGVRRDANIVVYCGCCPLTRCPNVRPALEALREMGFSRVKVLWLPQDFHTDWIEKGYPVEKSQ